MSGSILLRMLYQLKMEKPNQTGFLLILKLNMKSSLLFSRALYQKKASTLI